MIKSVIALTAGILFSIQANSINSSSCGLNTVTTYLNVSLPVGTSKIQVALLFDTSNSMDGLIDQAKSRLWDVVNTLTTLKFQGKTPVIEIALYEYGNDGLSSANNFIRQVTDLTTDLDLISEKLFALRTNGGSEYCGAVIATSIKQLKWDDGMNTMKLIYIAGNESFAQGGINYKEAINSALNYKVFINTIYCGDKNEGISLLWQDAALNSQGKYFNINSDKKVEYIATPYDQQINACNEKLNKTYIGYGTHGHVKKQSQEKEDANASSISLSNATERVVTKSKAVYKNATWDLVDNVKENEANLDKLKKEDLPDEYKNKSKEEIKKSVNEKAKEREVIKKEIGDLAIKRQKYIAEKSKEKKQVDDLGTAIKSSIVTLATSKGFTVAD
jgi:hypothetical protein